MNPIALIFFLICAIALLSVPRKWAPAVLLVGCTYITLGQGIEIASINLHIYRMMLLIGLLRVLTRGEILATGLNAIDKMLIAWGVWAVFASFFHDPARYGTIYACGVVFNLLVVYFLIRIWCNDLNEVREVIVVLALLLVPLALEMFQEKVTGKNLFAVFGAVSENVQSRGGKLRAQGPFLHAILAGTVGAACIPLFVGLFSKHKIIAMIGFTAGIVMTFTSASSGPVMTLLAGIGALLLWPFKQHVTKLRIGCVVMYFVLMGVMSRPPYYLIGEIDLAGGSTGWHRANLIEMTFAHLSEWWFIGTDFTRHWMPAQGIGADVNHTDITNYYIGMGVFAGLPSMLLIIGAIWVAFHWVGQILDSRIEKHPEESFMTWCFGASLFAHAVTGISVSYFDQSVLFFLLTIAVISSSYSINRLESQTEPLDKEMESYESLSGPMELTYVNAALYNAEWRRRYRDNVLLPDKAELLSGESLYPNSEASKP